MINMKSRTQKAKLNIATSLMTQFVTLVCGIIVPQLLIKTFSSEVYGATTSITQFLAYISLLEGGIAGVARAALYKPLAQNDEVVISNIVGEIKSFFRMIAFFFIVYTLVLASTYNKIAHTDFDWTFTFFLVIVISISTLAQYYFGIANSILLQADQKTYVNNLISTFATIINTIMIILLIYLDCSIIIVKLVSSCVFVTRPVLLSLYVKKKYNIHKPEINAPKALTQKYTALGQHIAYFLHSNTDIVLLTIFTNLKVVAVYSVYNMIVVNIRNITSSFTGGMESVFGNMLANNEKEKLQKTFSDYETLISIVATILFSVTAVLIIPFISIYTKNVTDANYFQPVFSVLIILAELIYCLRLPYHYMIIAAGHFKQTKIGAYGEAFINIVLSVSLVFKYGLVGVSFATLIAMIFRFIYYGVYLTKNVINRKIGLFIKKIIINLAGLIFVVGFGNILTTLMNIRNYFVWVICGGIVFILACLVVFFLNWCFYRSEVQTIIDKAVGKIKKH